MERTKKPPDSGLDLIILYFDEFRRCLAFTIIINPFPVVHAMLVACARF